MSLFLCENSPRHARRLTYIPLNIPALHAPSLLSELFEILSFVSSKLSVKQINVNLGESDRLMVPEIRVKLKEVPVGSRGEIRRIEMAWLDCEGDRDGSKSKSKFHRVVSLVQVDF